MKIFESAQKEFSKLGICLGINSNHKCPFNSRNIFLLILLCSTTILCGVQLFYIAKGYKEYTVSFYFTSAALTMTLITGSIIWETQALSKYLDSFEKIINESESTFRLKQNLWSLTLKLYENVLSFRTCAFCLSKNVYTK